MDQTNDDMYLPMDTESYEEKESFGRKTGRFCKKFLLIIVTIALLLFLILQFIIIAGGSTFKDEWDAYTAPAEAIEDGIEAAAEVIAEANAATQAAAEAIGVDTDADELPIDVTDPAAIADAIIEIETNNIETMIDMAA